jgi:hypothetical protein
LFPFCSSMPEWATSSGRFDNFRAPSVHFGLEVGVGNSEVVIPKFSEYHRDGMAKPIQHQDGTDPACLLEPLARVSPRSAAIPRSMSAIRAATQVIKITD